MQTAKLARGAYETTHRETATPRNIERNAFQRVTSMLISAEKTRDTDFTAYVTALSKNLQLWTVLGADVAGAENGLPAPLRAMIFELSEFTRIHTNKLISGEKGHNAGALIEINTNIIKGLTSTSTG